MDNLEYMFFLSGAPNVNPKLATAAFQDGLYDKSNNIFSTMMYVEATDEDIAMKSANAGFDMVYVIKIPKMLLMPTINAEHKLLDAPLPIWKKVDGRYYLSNELVYGICYRRDKSFVYNDNYKELHNPAGLVFDRRQEDYFKENNLDVWTKFSLARKKKDYTTLMNYDIDKNVWSSFIDSYNRHYNGNSLKK